MNTCTLTKQYKNTVQTIQNTINTNTRIAKTPRHYRAHTYTHPHITKPPHTHTHTLQNKLKQPQYKIHTKWNGHNTIKYPQYMVTLMCMVLLSPRARIRITVHEGLCTVFNISRLVLLRIWNISDKSCRENQKSLLCLITCFRKSCRLLDNVIKYCRGGQAIDDNVAHAHGMLHT
jgi:hypothetical protein